MESFAFLFHPLRHSDFARKFPLLSALPERWVEAGMKYLPPLHVSHVTGVVSATGARAEGDFLAVAMTPRVLLASSFGDFVLPRLVRAGKRAEELGDGILGLGAFTKIVGDRGVSVAKALSIPVTTRGKAQAGIQRPLFIRTENHTMERMKRQRKIISPKVSTTAAGVRMRCRSGLSTLTSRMAAPPQARISE